VEIHSAARKHGIADADIDHAVEHAMSEIAIHAMGMRARYQRLLPRG
jgi:hypothetical protein